MALRYTDKAVSDFDFSHSLQMYWLLVLPVLIPVTFNSSSVSWMFTTRHSISYGNSLVAHYCIFHSSVTNAWKCVSRPIH